MKNIETVYGDDVLPAQVAGLGDYVAVVDTIAWQLCRSRLPPPSRVLVPPSLEREVLDALSRELPSDARMVGIGGGLVIDATKYLAVQVGTTPLLVPSITSNDAPFSDSIAVRAGGVPIGTVVAGAPKRVVIDRTLIRSADPRLNRSGYADLLAGETLLADWRLAADAGLVELDEKGYDRLADIAKRARSIAGTIGAVSRWGVESLMRLYEEGSEVADEHPTLPPRAGSEHLLAWNIEVVTDRHFLHGEVVALGIITAACVQGLDHATLRGLLETAQVAYRPADLGIGRDEYEQALRTVADYNRRERHLFSVFDQTDWTPQLLTGVWAAVGGAR